MAKTERFRVNPNLEIPIVSGFKLESFDSIYYTYARAFLITAREHDSALGGALNLELINNSALSLLMSALGLESHINAFGIRHLGKEYFDSVDQLSPPNKFRIVTDLMSNQRNWLPNHLLSDLKLLFKLRNKLVHYKPMETDPLRKGSMRKTFFVDEKELGVRCFERTVVKLHELAPADDISWLVNSSADR